MQKLNKAWQDWIGENLARGCSRNTMLHDMIKAGIAEDTAMFNLANYVPAGGKANTNQSLASSTTQQSDPAQTSAYVQ